MAAWRVLGALGRAARRAGPRLVVGLGAGAAGIGAALGPRLADAEAVAAALGPPSHPASGAAPSPADAAAHAPSGEAAAHAEAGTGALATGAWPVYTKQQVAEHDSREKRIWVTYKDGVYDITEFVDGHPGGSRILLGAGKAIDAYWNLYPQHVNSSAPLEILETMRIGVLDARDAAEASAAADVSDPYANDPPASPLLRLHSAKPLQAETPTQLVTDTWITPNELFFVRGHHPIPDIDAHTYRLTVKGHGLPREFTFSLADLRDRFPRAEVVSTIQCGGNGRSAFNAHKRTMGIPWGCGAMSTARWSGARLTDVLAACGLTDADAEAAGVEHVQFEGSESMGASIPAGKAFARRGDVLLAYEMNGEPIPRAHGYPVRAIVPGHVGVRNVKWLSAIVTSEEEAQGPWQRGIAYKGFAPGLETVDGVDVQSVPSVQEQPVMSAITSPSAGDVLDAADGTVGVRGYAWSGGGRGIVRVDVSADGGETWHTAKLKEGSEQKLSRAWAWTFFEADVPLPAQPAAPRSAATGAASGGGADGPRSRSVEIVAKATDASYNTQPERIEPIWNLRGINFNAWPRVDITVDGG